MSVARCLITGCRLVVAGAGKHVWGDLHRAGEAIIFNAALNGRGEAAWEYDEAWKGPATLVEKQVTFSPHFPYFERRGVIVFDHTHMVLNKVAENYIRRYP